MVQFRDAAEIATGYVQQPCKTPGCNKTAWVAPWYVPYGDYCDGCRAERKDEAREDDLQDAKRADDPDYDD